MVHPRSRSAQNTQKTHQKAQKRFTRQKSLRNRHIHMMTRKSVPHAHKNVHNTNGLYQNYKRSIPKNDGRERGLLSIPSLNAQVD